MKKHSSIVIDGLLFFSVFLAPILCVAKSNKNDPSFSVVGNIDQVNFREPSDIVFHAKRGTLFVVGDNGSLGEIKTDGTPVKSQRIRKADFEGITYNPATGLLYLAIEGDAKILEIAPDSFAVLREFEIERTFEGKQMLQPGNSGIEGIAFVPDDQRPEGGTFFIVNQSKEQNGPKGISAVIEVEVPLKTKPNGGEAKILRYFSVGVTDLSAICYEAATGHLFVLSNKNKVLLETNLKGGILKTYALHLKKQEGFAIDGQGFCYVAQDSGGIIKIKWTRNK